MPCAAGWNRLSFRSLDCPLPPWSLLACEVGRPLLDKGAHTLAPVGCGEGGAEAGDLGCQPRRRIAGEGEGHQALGRADRRRAVPGDLSRHLSRRRHELAEWMNRVDQADAMCLVGVHLAPRVDHLRREAWADEPGQPLRAAPAGWNPQADFRLREAGVLCGEANIAGDSQFTTAA